MRAQVPADAPSSAAHSVPTASKSAVDVLIVGGAIIGSATAYFLKRLGFQGSVRVLEQDASYQRCATTRSAASIRHQFSTPENIRISQFGSEFIQHIGDWLAIDGETPQVDFVEGGYLFLASAAGEAVLRAKHAVQTGLGADVALLDPAALQARFPWLATDDLAAGSLGLSGEGWLDAYSLLRAFRRKAISLGAEYREARVEALLRSGRRVVGARLASGETVHAGIVINAAGTSAAQLALSAGISLPVVSRKRCVFYFKCRDALPGCPLVIDPSGAYFRPEGGGFICGISPEASADPECHDFDVDYPLFDEVLWPLLAARVPTFEAIKLESAWAGHYDMNSFDHNVILGPHPDIDNLLFANGFSGHGLQQAPAVGRALAEWVVHGGYRSLDLSPLGWARVLEGRPVTELAVV